MFCQSLFSKKGFIVQQNVNVVFSSSFFFVLNTRAISFCVAIGTKKKFLEDKPVDKKKAFLGSKERKKFNNNEKKITKVKIHSRWREKNIKRNFDFFFFHQRLCMRLK